MTENRKRKKSIKLRGSRTYGWGSHKKHRGAGSRGGRGMAGAKGQKATWFAKNNPNHLGKHGFKSLAQRNLAKRAKAVNVSELERMAEGKQELDLGKMGYSKVLGGGAISVALTVKADYFTEKARQKIEQAKGKAVGDSEGKESAGKAVEETKQPAGSDGKKA